MDLKKLEELVKFMEANDLCELEISEKDFKAKLAKSRPQFQAVAQPMPVAGSTGNQPVAAARNDYPPEKTVRSPFVGTFYASSRPGSEPFAKLGAEVKQGETLCIIEAMKIMNEIEAEKDGKIAKILVKNGDPVEFDQPVFVLE